MTYFVFKFTYICVINYYPVTGNIKRYDLSDVDYIKSMTRVLLFFHKTRLKTFINFSLT